MLYLKSDNFVDPNFHLRLSNTMNRQHRQVVKKNMIILGSPTNSFVLRKSTDTQPLSPQNDKTPTPINEHLTVPKFKILSPKQCNFGENKLKIIDDSTPRIVDMHYNKTN